MRNKGSIFYSIFILLSVIASSIIVFFVSSFYLLTSSNLEEEFSKGRAHNLEQTISTLESELQNIEYSFNAYSTTNSYQRVIEYPLSVRDFNVYNEITTQLNYFSTPNLQNTMYTLISLDQQWMINDNRLTEISDEQLEVIKSYYLENKQSDLYWDNSLEGSGMSVVTLLPIFSRSKSGIGIANVSTQDIHRLIENRNIHFPVAILNTDGDILYNTRNQNEDITSIVSDIVIAQIQEARANVGEIRVEEAEDPFTVIYRLSKHNNLIYITALYDSEIDESLTPVLLGVTFLSLLLILFFIILAWVAASHLTKPIRQLMIELVDGEAQPKTSNDFVYLRDSFEAIKSQKESLESVLELEKPALRRQFVSNAFLGRDTLEDLDKKINSYNFPNVESPRYYVLVAQLDERVSSETAVRLFKMLRIMEDVIPEENQMTPVVMTEENVATILIFGEDSIDVDKKLVEVSEAIITLAKEDSGLLVSIGLSPEYRDFGATRENYKKAVRSLSYKLLLGNQSIISFDDVRSIDTMSYSDEDLSSIKELVYQAIQIGELEDAKENTNLFLASLYRNSETPSLIEFGLLRFFINVSELDRSFGTDIIDRKLTERFYQNLLFHRNIIEIEQILMNDIIVPMTIAMEQRTNEQFQQLSNQIKEIIDERYDEDISLDIISDELNYNPNYISSIFRKETGVTFSDYLLEKRFDKAKELLVNTDMTVKEIAEHLKYSNSQNFIRSFKRIESVTPGKYRQENQVKWFYNLWC